MMNIKDLIKENTVEFYSYRQGFFYYSIRESGNNYIFPVPLDDIGTATLNKRDKAIVYMRWIRKAISDKTFTQI